MRRALLGLIISAEIFFECCSAFGQTYGNYLAGIEHIGLHISDNVKNGCWTRPEQTRQEVELELVRSNLQVGAGSTSYLLLIGAGFEVTQGEGELPSGMCVVSYQLVFSDCTSYSPSYRPNTSAVLCATIWNQAGVFIDDKSHSQRQITENFISFTREFLLNLEKDRRGVKPE